jgi:hypothetical protein
MQVYIWESDWGSIRLPDDMPKPFRIDGWFDHRFAIAGKVKDYLNDMTLRKRDGYEATSFCWWLNNRNMDVSDGDWRQP